MTRDMPPPVKPGPAQRALRHFADHSTMLVWMTDAEDNFVYLNPAAAALLGGEKLNISDWYGFIHPDDLERIIPEFRNARAKGMEYQLEYRIVRGDGSMRWMMGCGAPRFSASGEFLGFNGTVVDVTDRHEATERLAKSEAGHRLLTENSSDIISHHGSDGTLVYVSPSVKRVLGYEPAELVGTNIMDHVHPDDVQILLDEMFYQVENGAESRPIEFRKLNRAGRYVWLGSRSTFLVNPVTGDVTGIVSVTRDVTFERQAKAELRKREERFRSLINLSSDWYWETDENHCFVFISDGVQRSYGIAPEEIIGKTRVELAADLDQLSLIDYQAKVDKREAFRDIRYVCHLGGKTRHVNISGEPVFEDGRFKGFRGVGRDISDEMEFADKLAQIKEAERARIAREIHDELGGNLTAIKIALARLAKSLPAQQPQSMQRAAYLESLVDRTIDATQRIAHDLRPSVLDLGIAAAITWQAKEFEKQTGMPCVVSLTDPTDLLAEQATCLFRVFQEALTNVCKHAGASRVTVRLRKDNNSLRLEVSDDGCGMSASDRLKPNSFGLRGMSERLTAMGGRLEVGAASEGGCAIRAFLPYCSPGG